MNKKQQHECDDFGIFFFYSKRKKEKTFCNEKKIRLMSKIVLIKKFLTVEPSNGNDIHNKTEPLCETSFRRIVKILCKRNKEQV